MITAEMHNNAANVGLHYHDGNTPRHRNNHRHHQMNRHAYEMFDESSPSTFQSDVVTRDVTRGVVVDEYYRRSSTNGTGYSSSQHQLNGATSSSSPDSVSSSDATQSSRPGPKILFNLLSLGGSRDPRDDDDGDGPYDGRRNERRAMIDGYMGNDEETMNIEFQTENHGGRPINGTHSAPSALGGHSSTSGAYCNTIEQRQVQGDALTTGSSVVTTAAGEFLVPSYYRPRSKSMGTNGWRPPDYPSASAGGPGWWTPMPGGGYSIRGANSGVSRTPSRDSLVSYDESIASSDDCGSIGGGQALVLSSATAGHSGLVRYQVGGQTGPAHSRKSYAIFGSASSREEALLEDTRSRLMTLRTSDRPPETLNGGRECFSHSQPGSPPSSSPVSASQTSTIGGGCPDGGSRSQQLHYRHVGGSQNYYQMQQQPQPNVRKYSEGSQLMRTHLHGRWRNRASSIVGAIGVSHSSPSSAATATSGSSESPVDLSCKRKKFDAGSATSAGLPYARRPSMSSGSGTGNGNYVGSSSSSSSSSSRFAGIPPPPPNDFQPSFMTSSERLNGSVDEGIENIGDCDDAASDISTSSSILRSILLQTGRGRSYSMSVCMTGGASARSAVVRGHKMELSSSNGRPQWQPMHPEETATQLQQSSNSVNRPQRDQLSQTTALMLPTGAAALQQQQRHQKVVLAKKNQLPVLARVADHLGKVVELVRAVPRFSDLPLGDRRLLLSNSCGRLLLLYMAESNTQFAVTSISGGGGPGGAGGSGSMGWSSSSNGDTPPPIDETDSEPWRRTGRSMSFSSGSWSTSGVRVGMVARDAEVPTQQFVDGVQNFIRKCQAFGLGPEEYFHMRVIALFQSGAGTTLERTNLVDQVNSDARQRLQDLIQRTHSTEKLRYSNVLLLLHTLFGIHCGMLQSLFFRPTPTAAGFDEFVWNALKAAESVSSDKGFDAVPVDDDAMVN